MESVEFNPFACGWRESAYSTERMRQNRPEREVWSMGFGRGGRGVLGPPRISEFDILPLTFQSQNVFLLVSEVAKRNLAIVAPWKKSPDAHNFADNHPISNRRNM